MLALDSDETEALALPPLPPNHARLTQSVSQTERDGKRENSTHSQFSILGIFELNMNI